MPLCALFSLDISGPARIPLSMLIVFVSAKLLAEIFERFGQPGIVGEILAGVVVGPSVLGLLAPTDFLAALSELGGMFLLFRVGLEVKSSELLRVGGAAALVAVSGVIVPFIMGAAILLLWGGSGYEAIFVGAAMVATSVGITARVLTAQGLLGELSSKVILAAAVIDDVLGLLVLAVVSSVSKGRLNWLDLGITAALAIGFTVIVGKWGTSAMGRIIPHVDGRLRVAEAQFAFALCLLFALSLLAVYTGVAAIVGAFLAGMALAESTTQRVHDLAHGVTELLVPFFLAGIGLHVNLAAFTEWHNAVLALLILGAAIASKFFGCGIGALPLGRVEAFRIAVGMVPRGEVGMVVAQLGLAMGIMTQNIYGVVVFMSVATTVIAPSLLRFAYRDLIASPSQGGRDPAGAEEEVLPIG